MRVILPLIKHAKCDHKQSSEINDDKCGFCKTYYEKGETWLRVRSAFTKAFLKNRISFHVDDFPWVEIFTLQLHALFV